MLQTGNQNVSNVIRSSAYLRVDRTCAFETCFSIDSQVAMQVSLARIIFDEFVAFAFLSRTHAPAHVWAVACRLVENVGEQSRANVSRAWGRLHFGALRNVCNNFDVFSFFCFCVDAK